MKRTLRILTPAAVAAAALLAPSPVAASPGPAPPDLAIEGISLGQSFAEVDSLLHLAGSQPVRTNRGKLYSWTSPRRVGATGFAASTPFPVGVNGLEEEGLGHSLRGLKVEFERDRVVGVVATYSSAAPTARVGPDLIARYGVPSWIRRGASRGISSDGQRVSQRVEVWGWQWSEAMLLVIAEHYRPERGDPVVRRPPGVDPIGTRHFFHFRLSDSGE